MDNPSSKIANISHNPLRAIVRIAANMMSLRIPLLTKSRGSQLFRYFHRSVTPLSSIPHNRNFSLLNFTDPVVSFRTKSSFELIRSIAVFTICRFRPLVTRSDKLLKLSYYFLGKTLTNGVLRLSFFNHFCAGEDERGIKPKVDYLHENGIGSILDYAAEADIASKETDTVVVEKRMKEDFLQARVYDYEDENLCDARADTFRKCILAVHAVSPTGFAAIKCTALGNPLLLERMSSAIVELRTLFSQLDVDNKGYVTRQQFTDAYGCYFTEIPTKADVQQKYFVDIIFDSCDVNKDDRIDYVEWIDGLNFEELHAIVSSSKTCSPFLKASLNVEEMALLANLRSRVHTLAQLACDLGVRLMIDAEHTYFQPAIDNITMDLNKKYNRGYPVIFSTYQMYLKDSAHRLEMDVDRAKKGNYCFAAKLVRGAYMVLERSRAIEMNYEDPIHESLSKTNDNYDSALKGLIEDMATGSRVEVMIATHNRHSVELALQTMADLNLPPQSNVYFGQLLGMSDNMTFTLGNAGYKAYKYVPYGKVQEVMPYLIRRAQENSDALSGAKEELSMMSTELKRRLFSIGA